MNKFKLISLCTLGALGCGTASIFLNSISASARYYDLRNERSNSEIKLEYIKVENVSEKSLDVIIKYNSETEITSNGFPVWSTGYYYDMKDVPEENITKIGYNEFKVRIDMREVGNGSDYIYIGLHPRDKNGSHFVIDFAIKLDETAPNLEKTLYNDKNWTNQNVSLKAKANDNFNIVEFLKLYKDDKVVKEYETFSNPKILYISLDDDVNRYKDFINLGYNITAKNSNSIKSINDVKGYDLIIYDGLYWSIPSELAVILNQAFDEGESLLTTFNDGSNGIAIAKDEIEGTSGKYTFSSPYKYAGAHGAYHNLGRSDRFAYRLNDYSETDSGLSILKPADKYSIVLSKSVCTDYKGENKVGEGAGVLYRTGVDGNKWIHMQTYSPMYNNAMRKAIDEIMTGVLKTRQNYERNFEITENGNYKVEAVDFFGNKKEENFTISNIDKVAPELDYIDGTKGWNNTGKYKIVCKDNLSGVKSISVNGNVYNSSSADVEFANNGEYDLVITDNAGNVTNQKITINNIDKDVPNICNISSKTTFIDKDSSKRKLTFSFPSLLDVQSGIKGYSYIIDKNPNTIPDDVVDTTNTTIERDITDGGAYYLHIKAIDNVGNVSNVVHHKVDVPTLTAKSNPNENMIRLDWSMSDLKNKTFKVYQKKPGSNDYQSISATNLNKSKQIRVLNIYPKDNGELTDITYSTWDGEHLTTKSSAQLKKWMEEPNSENPKGYGKGLIEVTPVAIEDFNANPDKYLKNSNGEYNYDVMAFGIWDANCHKDISETACASIKEFINSGRGVFFGHDTIRIHLSNFSKLADALNIKLSDSALTFGGEKTIISKKGLLTNYPWNIGDVGTVLSIPYSHTLYQMANGDIWLKYGESIDNNNLNFFLTTWNNVAFSQTGHSGGKATPDEQKILANTIFYLNQLSNENYLNDCSGQDIKAPNMPQIYNHNFIGSNKIEFKFNEVKDNGSEYSYYVESKTKDNNSSTLSNITKETITSGLKGYSYIVDNNPNTVPDNNVNLDKSKTSLTIEGMNKQKQYLHIKSIDNAGNSSEVLHFKVEETSNPTIDVMGNPTDWTNKDVELKIDAKDLGSGVSHIQLPNNQIVKGSQATYKVSANGIYTFKVYDYFGNETVKSVNVNKIDKDLPELNHSISIDKSKNTANVTLQVKDSLSGIKNITLPDGKTIDKVDNYSFELNNNGMYCISVIDNANNVTSKYITINDLNSDVSSGIDRIEYKLSGATTKDWTTYDKPFYISNEGITYITARSYDKAGNVSTEATSEVKIDKTSPTNNRIKIQLK